MHDLSHSNAASTVTLKSQDLNKQLETCCTVCPQHCNEIVLEVVHCTPIVLSADAQDS